MSKEAQDKLETRKIEIFKAFNKRSKDGIKILKEIYGEDEELYSHITSFLINNKENLNPVEVGDYLGTEGSKKKDGADEQKSENERVLEHFVERMDFKDKSFVDALRVYLKSFKLPGEAQKISRVMEAFGKRYVEQNPGGDVVSTDAAFILSFACVMLSTDRHNPSVKNKMTFNQFDKNLPTDEAKKRVFTLDFVKQVYRNIISEKFEFVEPRKASIEFEQSNQNLKNDTAYKKYSAEAKKPWYSFLVGSTVTTSLERDGGAARITISEPSLFGKLVGRKPDVKILAGKDDKADSSDLDNKLIAKVAAEFGLEPKMITTYPYQKDEMEKEYNKARGVTVEVTSPQKDLRSDNSLINSPEVNKTVAELKNIGVGGEIPKEEKRGIDRIAQHREGGKS